MSGADSYLATFEEREHFLYARVVGPRNVLRKIAYVDPAAQDPGRPAFAANVAANRGVNVRFFGDAEAASRWLAEP